MGSSSWEKNTMALLTLSKSPKGKRKPGSTAPGSSVPSSLPDSANLELIESLKKELAEAKTSRDATAQEIADLKAQLKAAQEKAAEVSVPAVSQLSESTKANEQTTGKSFFGY
jgi:hypothetical protein